MTAGVGVSAPTAPRVGIVGVRRLRQGLGEHFARWLVAAGAQVPAFIGRTPESIDEGRRLLLARGIDARGFTSLDALMEAEPIEALVIASPAETHAEWLLQAWAEKLHVLCEKPLLWGGDGLGSVRGDVLDGLIAHLEYELPFHDRLLVEHCQWPYTLAAFRRLHPGTDGEPLRTLEMELCPDAAGPQMLVDSMSHPLSLFQALVAANAEWRRPAVAELRFSTHDPCAERAEVVVVLRSETGRERIDLTVRLARTPTQPRPAAYAINGRRAERRVSLPDYSMTLADGGREVPMEDPMRLAVADFVRAVVEARLPARDRPNRSRDLERMRQIPVRLRLLSEIVSAFRSRSGD